MAKQNTEVNTLKAKLEHEKEIIALLNEAKPGIAIRRCVEYGISVEEWGSILRRGIREEIWGHEKVTLCYGIVWAKKKIQTT